MLSIRVFCAMRGPPVFAWMYWPTMIFHYLSVCLRTPSIEKTKLVTRPRLVSKAACEFKSLQQSHSIGYLQLLKVLISARCQEQVHIYQPSISIVVARRFVKTATLNPKLLANHQVGEFLALASPSLQLRISCNAARLLWCRLSKAS